MSSQFVNYFKEMLHRLRTRSPKFFLVLSIFGVCLAALGYVPAAIDRWTNIIVSQNFINFCEDVSNWAKGFILATLFASETKPTAMTPEGDVLKKLDEAKYPFTAEVEKKRAEAEATPTVKDPMPNQPTE
jgi:hypothetical protein